MERRAWTAMEDQVLKNLYEKVKVNKWSLISKTMQEQYKLPARTGKQCRERYNNHLNPSFAKAEWTREEQELLFSLHNELGNKWAIIATKLGGRTDNGVKNHYFAKLRKSMRRMNRIIQKQFKKKLRELKISVLYKIVEASEQKFKDKPMCDAQTSEYSCRLKNEILKFAHERQEETQIDGFKQLIDRIIHFGKTYKRRPKQLRRIPNKNQVFPDQISPDSAFSQDLMDSIEKDDSEDEIVRIQNAVQISFDSQKIYDQDVKRELRSMISKVAPSEMMEVPENEAQYILKGLLVEEEEEHNILLPPPSLMKRQTNSEAMGDSLKSQNEFFQQSRNHCAIPPLMFMSADLQKSMEDQLFHL